ncbi:sulfurtransferase [Sporofaciens musculi]|uniref:sulfurtransferase n=1 Tax=Sporofaciens musculi TaxID=2681861 RepID=UPI002570CF0B|nr:rhodanese-like domain-containing protein [Sporofaciens musculi]
MKKRLLSVLLSMAVVATLAVGCGSGSDDATDKTQENTADEQKEDTDSSDGETEDTADVEPVEQRTVYVTPEWVKSAIDGNQAGYEEAVIAEVTYTGELDDSESYKKGHIPGAILVGDTEVEDAEGTEEKPYNLLTPEEVETYMLSHGITKDTKVILYGEDVSGVGRVAYAYLWAGVEDVKILNGGLNAWEKAGYDLETDVNEGTKADSFGTTVPAHPEFWVSIENAKDRLENDDNFKLVSIRSEDEWLGKTSGYKEAASRKARYGAKAPRLRSMLLILRMQTE